MAVDRLAKKNTHDTFPALSKDLDPKWLTVQSYSTQSKQLRGVKRPTMGGIGQVQQSVAFCVKFVLPIYVWLSPGYSGFP